MTEERRVGRVTTRGAGDRLRQADEGLLQRQDDASFVHTDPWRVLRIMGEFVDGFDVLARVGMAVTVFGVLLFHYLLSIPFPLLRGVNL